MDALNVDRANFLVPPHVQHWPATLTDVTFVHAAGLEHTPGLAILDALPAETIEDLLADDGVDLVIAPGLTITFVVLAINFIGVMIGTIRGGRAPNVIPDEARAVYDLYLASAEMARALGRPIPFPPVTGARTSSSPASPVNNA